SEPPASAFASADGLDPRSMLVRRRPDCPAEPPKPTGSGIRWSPSLATRPSPHGLESGSCRVGREGQAHGRWNPVAAGSGTAARRMARGIWRQVECAERGSARSAGDKRRSARPTARPGPARPALEVAALCLLPFDGFEQRLEVADAEAT